MRTATDRALTDHREALAWVGAQRLRPAGWTDASTAGVLGLATSVLNTGSAYLQGDRQLDALAQGLALQQANIAAQAGAASARAEGAPLAQAIRLRLAQEAAAAQGAQQSADTQALAAQLQALATLDAQRGRSTLASQPSSSTASTSNGHGTILAVGVVVAAVGAAAVVWATRKRRR